MPAQIHTTTRAINDMSSSRRQGATAVLIAVIALLAGLLAAVPAQAAGPQLAAEGVALTTPTWRGGDQGSGLTVVVRNTGDATLPGGTVLTYKVDAPDGVTVRGAAGAATCNAVTSTCTTTTAGPLNPNVTSSFSMRFSIDKAVAGEQALSFEVSAVGVPPATLHKTIAVEPYRPFGVNVFTAGAYDAGGAPFTQAGGHPDSASLEFRLNLNTRHTGFPAPVEDMRRVVTELPAGFTGNPLVVEACTEGEMVREVCPPESQVGVIEVDIENSVTPTGIYRIAPQPGVTAQFGFAVVGVGVAYMFASVRTDGDNGITITVPSTPQAPATLGVKATLWGTPADPKWDAQRCARVMAFFCVPKPSTMPKKPFLTMQASECTDVAPVTRLLIDSWQHMNTFVPFEATSPPVTGCEKPAFNPSVNITPSTTTPDAPTGLQVDMAFPQEDDDEGLSPPALKKAVVTLPEGMTINPSGAGGLAACTDDRLKLKSKEPVTCPNASKIGEVTAKSPLMEETLSGGVYIRSQNSLDPESGEMFRIALVLESEERGVSVRLPGQIRVNRRTGRIETTFDNNPELPVSSLKLTLKDGPRAPLATPASCGPKTIDTLLTSWGKQVRSLQSTFDVLCLPGLGSFGPGFDAGTKAPVAGASSPFNLLMTRADGHDVIDGLSVKLPEGLLANLKGNVGTQVGTVTADAGPGSQPYRFPGKVFLEGPYKDAPFSLRVVIPAKAGPFDLGEVVVRQRILVDPTTAQVTVVSDPIPTIVEGVPVRLRNMSVDVDKPGFMLNPTSCAQKRIDATASSLGGRSAHVASRFQVGGCAALPLKPKMTLSLTGKNETGYHKHPGLSAEVTQTPGESGLKKVTVSLPLSLALDPDNAKALCKPEQAAAKACPEGAIIGDATAISPVLNRPLTGHVYFVEGLRTSKTGRVIKTLPKLWVALRGEVSLDVWADSAVKDRRLVNTFATVPDAPISSFKLNIKGGENGILKVTGKQGNTLCKGNQVADAQFDGQNGKRLVAKTSMTTPCGFKAVSASLGASKARVVVGGLGKGRLTLSGSGIRKTSRSVSSDVVTVNATLTSAGKRAYRTNRPLKVKATFKPTGGKAKSVTVAVRRAKAKEAARR